MWIETAKSPFSNGQFAGPMMFASHLKTFSGEANLELTSFMRIWSFILDSFKSLFSPHREADDFLDLGWLYAAAGDALRRKLQVLNIPISLSLCVRYCFKCDYSLALSYIQHINYSGCVWVISFKFQQLLIVEKG